MHPCRFRGVTLVLVLLGMVCAVPAGADVSGPDIVSYLNAQRAAQGVPAGIVEDAGLSDGCAKHNAYGKMNGVVAHSEDPSRPGYTPEGDRAARTSVLYAGSGPWTASRNPFETAPIHLHQLLAPRLDRMGASENQGYGCATTLASRNRPAPSGDVTYTYPGNGATNWPSAQIAAEGPYTPGERVGIPAGTETGPYLYVMFDGPNLTPFDTARATSATLTGPTGPVAVAVVDNHTSGLEGYLPTGMEVIPRQALQAGATYTVSVAASVSTQGGGGPTRAFSRTWSFTTAGGGGGVANDLFANAATISADSGAVTVTGSTVGAGKEPGEPNHAGNAGGASVWFKWTAARSGATTVDTCGSGFDTVLAAYTGASVGALSAVASDDDANAGSCSGTTQSQISFAAVAGSSYAFAIDGYDGQTGAVTLTLTPPRDTTAPDTSIDSGPSGTVSSASATFGFSSSESGSSFECKLDGGSFQACSSPKSYTGLSDGSHTYAVRATDAAGNTDATPATRTWMIQRDTTPPDTSIDSGPSGTVSSASATFGFSSSESGSSFECKLDGGSFQACSSPKSYTNLTDGQHTFEVRATDAAGNTHPTPATRTWTVQTGTTPPPQPALGIAKAGSGFGAVISIDGGLDCGGACLRRYSRGTVVTLRATPSASSRFAGWSGVDCPGTGACTVTLNADTTVTAWFSAEWFPAPPPNTQLAKQRVNGRKRWAKFAFSGSGGSGTLRFQCRIDGRKFRSCRSPVKYKNLKTGLHVFRVRAVDARSISDSTAATARFRIG